MATFKTMSDSKKLFVPANPKDEDSRSRLIRFERGTVILDVMGTKVVFSKTSRGSKFFDSRSPKNPLTEWEVKDELARMLDTPKDAADAFAALNV
jgi:hypothetical protein